MRRSVTALAVPDPLAALHGVPVAVISDSLDRLAGPVGLVPFHRGGPMYGLAVTVRTRPGDNLAIHRALELLTPGDVLVVDGGGDVSRALVGGIVKAIAEAKGCAGFVIDGAIRDRSAFAESAFPCFARAVIHRGPYKDGPGEINVPVSIGGSVIAPGDIVVGDEDGVIAFDPVKLPDVVTAAKTLMAREDAIMASIANGSYRGAYGVRSSES